MNQIKNFDAILIGKNIRKARKEKGYSIAVLSSLCKISVGKLSNIENGKTDVVSKNDINKIAKALMISVDDIIIPEAYKFPSELEPVIDELQMVNNYISMNLIDLAKENLHTIKSELFDNHYDYLKPCLNFLSGEIEKQAHNFESAIQFFSSVINVQYDYIYGINYKIRSINALSCLYFSRFQIAEALDTALLAVDLLTNKGVSQTEVLNTHFNLAIFYTYAGYLSVGLLHAKSARTIAISNLYSNYKHEVCYLIGVIELQRKEYINAFYYLKETSSYFQREKDIQYLYRCIYSLYLLIDHLPAAEKKMITSLEQGIVTDFYDYKLNNDQIYIYLSLIHKIVEKHIQSNEYDQAFKLLNMCLEYKRDIPEDRIHYKTHHLLAKLTNKMNGDPELVKQHLVDSLSYLSSEKSKVKAMILYELAMCSTDEKDNSPFQESSNIFYEIIKKETQYKRPFNVIIPDPKY